MVATMSKYPLVSIIIPTYNYGRYLADAIESALQQTYPNIEIIVVDDGSTDMTRDIAGRYPVHYIYQKNQGPATAMNNGISLSHGEFFVCLGADDKLMPEFIRKTLEKATENPNVGFVVTGSKTWIEELKFENILMPRKIRNKYAIVLIGWVGALGTILTRRIAFDSLDGGYDTSLPAHEDVDLAFRLCSKGWKAETVFEPLHWYRFHRSSRNPKTPERTRYYWSFMQRKHKLETIEMLYSIYQMSVGRLVLLMRHPIQYPKQLKIKAETSSTIDSYCWRDQTNREKIYELVKEMILTLDLLIEWCRNKELREYYEGRLRILNSYLQKTLDDDIRISTPRHEETKSVKRMNT